jgi:hypothetical protein
MKYLIQGNSWPVNGGAALIPAGTILDFANPSLWEFVVSKATIPPWNSVPLDLEADAALQTAYRAIANRLARYTVPP